MKECSHCKHYSAFVVDVMDGVRPEVAYKRLVKSLDLYGPRTPPGVPTKTIDKIVEAWHAKVRSFFSIQTKELDFEYTVTFDTKASEEWLRAQLKALLTSINDDIEGEKKELTTYRWQRDKTYPDPTSPDNIEKKGCNAALQTIQSHLQKYYS